MSLTGRHILPAHDPGIQDEICLCARPWKSPGLAETPDSGTQLFTPTVQDFQHIEQSSCGLFVADFELSRAKLFLESFHAALIHLHQLKVGWGLHRPLTLAAPQMQRLGNACIYVLYVWTQPASRFFNQGHLLRQLSNHLLSSQKYESKKGGLEHTKVLRFDVQSLVTDPSS